ncbi:MAG TPA: hypothetical protein VG455_03005 [Acidimicrobiales bacterium]|nr:hypothetical protein [Acidimicrobiales bacterium]
MDIGLATIVTLIGVFAIAAVLAGYLIVIVVILREVSFNVGTVLIGVRAIANQCAPLGPVIRDIVGDVRAIEEDLEALLGGTSSRRRPARR